MLRVEILCVGKLKEKFFREAVEEYAKRLSAYCRLEILEAADERTPDKPSPVERMKVLQAEGERLKKFWKPQACHIALAVEGRKMSSEAFSAWMEDLTAGKGGEPVSTLQFIIGGSLGLAPELLKNADLLLSFSDMTFPHQLMRVILLEQIYRGFRIARGEPYHK